MRIGSPITGYGQESRNRAARQRIPHRIWTDEDGVEQIEVVSYRYRLETLILLLMALKFSSYFPWTCNCSKISS